MVRNLPVPVSESQLLVWLLEVLAPMSRSRIKELLKRGQIVVNGTSTTRFDHPLKPGDRVSIGPQAAVRKSGDVLLERVFEDDSLIVIDKPAGLLTVATATEKVDTAYARLRYDLEVRRGGRPYVVHRLDRETSGLLLFARSEEIRDALQLKWQAVRKTYLAIIEGQPEAAEGEIRNYLTEGKDLRVRAGSKTTTGAKLCVTRYRVLATERKFSLVEVDLETGRKHQIRVHLAGLGFPVIGDEMYGSTSDPVRRLGLHAWKLAFDHPLTGKRIEVEAPLPEVLRRLMGDG